MQRLAQSLLQVLQTAVLLVFEEAAPLLLLLDERYDIQVEADGQHLLCNLRTTHHYQSLHVLLIEVLARQIVCLVHQIVATVPRIHSARALRVPFLESSTLPSTNEVACVRLKLKNPGHC